MLTRRGSTPWLKLFFFIVWMTTPFLTKTNRRRRRRRFFLFFACFWCLPRPCIGGFVHRAAVFYSTRIDFCFSSGEEGETSKTKWCARLHRSLRASSTVRAREMRLCTFNFFHIYCPARQPGHLRAVAHAVTVAVFLFLFFFLELFTGRT